ncbi:trinucleotide repeat-containing gene 6C protein [Lates japonicus]|uniref:Trinucleotide repeat-containing gene 6C protein n=1 Tax=Lates japonicus TaxID=270547 RepID=A0AAD3RDF9_LATJO|nr:trinucleotide repeat-containing gene 6C protein [Lates japonicus]
MPMAQEAGALPSPKKAAAAALAVRRWQYWFLRSYSVNTALAATNRPGMEPTGWEEPSSIQGKWRLIYGTSAGAHPSRHNKTVNMGSQQSQ